MTFLENIRQTGFSETDIHKQLTIPGSRFYPEFASDMESLKDRLEEGVYITQKEANGNLRFIVKAEINAFPDGVGSNAVVPFYALTIDQQSRVFCKRNRGYDVQHLLVNTLPSTNQIIIILKPVKQGFKFITAFPGEQAMPMPHRGMKPALFKACKEFWDQHVILLKD